MKKEEIDVKLAKEIIEKQNKTLRKVIPQGYIFKFVYGVAWLIGYGALAYTNLSREGNIIFISSLVIATLICAFYLIKTLKGVKTESSPYLAFWGISWTLGFGIHIAIMIGLSKVLVGVDAGTLRQVSWTVGNSVPLLIVCLCFLGGASLFKDSSLGLLAIIVGLVIIISANQTPSIGAMVCAVGGLIMLLFSLFDFYHFKKVI